MLSKQRLILIVARLCLLSTLFISPAVFSHETLCTIFTDVTTEKNLLEKGVACRKLFTPASSAKLFFAVVGFDTGYLTDPEHPTEQFKEGYDDWLDVWKQDITPKLWLKYSVVWYTQLLAQEIGQKQLEDYAHKLKYGNADFSGSISKHNGLDRAWISSSLLISPHQQAIFLKKLITNTLPISPDISIKVENTLEANIIDGNWIIRGKTGMAYPQREDQTLDTQKPLGWFIGWAQKGQHQFVFVKLIQDTKKEKTYTSYRARDEMLSELPQLLLKFNKDKRE